VGHELITSAELEIETYGIFIHNQKNMWCPDVSILSRLESRNGKDSPWKL